MFIECHLSVKCDSSGGRGTVVWNCYAVQVDGGLGKYYLDNGMMSVRVDFCVDTLFLFDWSQFSCVLLQS